MIAKRFALLLTGAAAVMTSVPLAARDPATPEQRIQRLEKQVRQVQKSVFPKGQPADSAGFSDDPAATQSSVSDLTGRLDAVEKQMADLTRAAEENGNRLSVIETDVARLRADQDRRFRAIESAPAAAATDAAPPEINPADIAAEPKDAPPPRSKPKVETGKGKTKAKVAEADAPSEPLANASVDPAEAAYDTGFNLWTAGKYDAAHTSLLATAKKYPDSRRASWAYNLAGRALLDGGKPRGAAEELLANYRRDPKGERAQDSVFYLGKSLVKLGQSSQACKAYAELQEVYGAAIRGQVKAMLPAALAEAKCR